MAFVVAPGVAVELVGLRGCRWTSVKGSGSGAGLGSGSVSVGGSGLWACSRRRCGRWVRMMSGGGSVGGGGGGKRQKKSRMSPGLAQALDKYEPVVGVEVHVQLDTRTKAFCSCSTRAARTPNANVCPVCMGHPGSLPVLNEKVVEIASKCAMALNCSIAPFSKFDRKNYFYPDTPKNYQISQFDLPIAEHGFLVLSSGKQVGVTRLHMEEDSGKLIHEGSLSGRLADSTHSLVDYNRAGIPLCEIVSEPDMRSGQEAAEYGQELQRVLRFISASDCNMQDGSLRLDVNVSIRPKGQESFGVKVELKNLNSFASVQRAVDYEIERQAGVLDAAGKVIQETRLWDEKELITKTMRVKEGSADYRYFPEPDILPLQLPSTLLDQWKEELPALPADRRARYLEEFELSDYDAFVLTDDIAVADYFEETVAAGAPPKLAVNWIMGDMIAYLKEKKKTVKDSQLRPTGLAELISLIENGTTSGKIMKDLLPELIETGDSASRVIEARGLTLISDEGEIRLLVSEILSANPKEFNEYKAGKVKLFGFFVGKMMEKTRGLVAPQMLNDVLRDMLDN